MGLLALCKFFFSTPRFRFLCPGFSPATLAGEVPAGAPLCTPTKGGGAVDATGGATGGAAIGGATGGAEEVAADGELIGAPGKGGGAGARGDSELIAKSGG